MKLKQEPFFFKKSILEDSVGEFLSHIAYGRQSDAESMVMSHPELLLKAGQLKDPSRRKFKDITAYDYAYWAKDTHMCRMLEKYMSTEIKSEVLKRCKVLDEIGLTYTQSIHEHREATVKGSKHFDLKPLIKAYENYIRIYTEALSSVKKLEPTVLVFTDEQGPPPELNEHSGWIHYATQYLGLFEKYEISQRITKAWMQIGAEQLNVPDHVAQEFWQKKRPLSPTPTFKEETLPRKESLTHKWFHLRWRSMSVAIRGSNFKNATYGDYEAVDGSAMRIANKDLNALYKLHTIRTDDLEQSLENLKLDPKTTPIPY